MVEIRNVEVNGLETSIIASGYAMTTEPYDYKNESFTAFDSKHFPRAKRLAKCGGGSGHSNFRTGILVSFDIRYPQYLSPELQRYHFMQIVTSQSKMHSLLRMDVDSCCNEWVSKEALDTLKRDIEFYNSLDSLDPGNFVTIKLRSGKIIHTSDKAEALYHAWMRVISDCPMGLELWMRVTTNYEQLATVYRQRLGHKLKDDWGEVLKFIERLPYASELITCQK